MKNGKQIDKTLLCYTEHDIFRWFGIGLWVRWINQRAFDANSQTPFSKIWDKNACINPNLVVRSLVLSTVGLSQMRRNPHCLLQRKAHQWKEPGENLFSSLKEERQANICDLATLRRTWHFKDGVAQVGRSDQLFSGYLTPIYKYLSAKCMTGISIKVSASV